MSSHKISDTPETQPLSIGDIAKQAVLEELANPGEKLYVGKRPKVEIQSLDGRAAHTANNEISNLKPAERTICDRINHIRSEVAELDIELGRMFSCITARIG